MVAYNERVLSNVPISFDYLEEETGELKHYEAEPWNLDQLIKLEDTLEACTIVWDEMSLDIGSRSGQSVQNRLIGGAATLVGKMDLSILGTLQFMRLLHVDLRDQMDAEFECFDLSFQYPHFKRGAMISQTFRDISGRFTGRLFEKSGMEYQRTLHGEEFFGTYPTKFRYDILGKMGSKYRLKMGTKVITNEALEQHDDSAYPADPRFKQVYDLTAELGVKGDKYRKDDLREYVRQQGVDLDDQSLGSALAQAGWKIRKGTIFYHKVT